jgi:hypothetical protein
MAHVDETGLLFEGFFLAFVWLQLASIKINMG